MIPKSCKRLAEVDFPIAEVSKHAVREKSIRHGHPSTLHLWWARRPLAACRAILLGLLWPDPCDPLCPGDFKAKARELLPKVGCGKCETEEDLRRGLLRFIADFANWDLAASPTYLEVSRALVKAAHGDEPPLVVDPFAGGGSIPLEALRLGCEAFASDLNPVACLILKVMLEDIPRHGPRLAEELRRVGGEIKKQAEKELAEFYPKDPDGATPIAYLWARTVRCESPDCGAEIPLVRSFWLCKKANRKRALRPIVHRKDIESTEKRSKDSQCPLCLRGEFPHVVFEIFEPKSDKDVPKGTVTRAKATCLCCGRVLSPDRVRAQLAAQRGGADVIFARGTAFQAVLDWRDGDSTEHHKQDLLATELHEQDAGLHEQDAGLHGQDAHATEHYGQDTNAEDSTCRGTAFQAVVDRHAQDAGGAEHHGQDARATNMRATCWLGPNDVVRIRQGAYLPHWTKEGSTYAVTFRLADSLPAEIWKAWLLERDEIVKRAEATGRPLTAQERRRLQELHSQRVENYLDAGHGACYLRHPEIAEMVRDTLLHFDGQRYDLIAWCIMPNHVHVVVRPRPGHELSSILHSWKSYSATLANRLLNRSGPFWQPEYYDHLIRDEDDFIHAVEYVLENPRKAGLKDWLYVGYRGTAFQAVLDWRDGDSTEHHKQDPLATELHEQDAGLHGQDAHAAEHYGQDTNAEDSTCRGTAFQAVVDGHPQDADGAKHHGLDGDGMERHGQDARATELHGQDAHVTRVGGARLLAVVTLRPGEQGRHYRLPTDRDYQAVWGAQQRLKAILDNWERGGRQGPCPVPDEPTPTGGGSGAGRAFSVRKYGMLQWGDLFTARQKVALASLVALASSQCHQTSHALRAAMATVVDRCADKWASLVVWNIVGEKTEHVFGRQALPVVWDYCEANPFTDATGGYDGALEWVAKVAEAWPPRAGSPCHAQVQLADAAEHPLPDETAHVWFTDPPYYDAVPYADLSDFFFVWVKRTLPDHPLLRDPFDPDNVLTPKQQEVVQDETKFVPVTRASSPCSAPSPSHGQDAPATTPKDRDWFEQTMAKAFAEGRRVLREDGVGAVVFAHKTTEGWEALLSGLIKGGWTITGSWPIATEMATRLRARDSAALATSVHLVCRPRPEDAPVGDWGEVLRELPKRVGDWMERLQAEGIRGADLVFACIGPALEIFSRYRRVETPEGREITLAEYLEKVWEVVGRAALEQVLGSGSGSQPESVITGRMPVPQGALEEDARLTALFLWTLQSTNGNGATAEDAEDAEDVEAEEDAEAEEDGDEEDTAGDARATRKAKGFSLVFDVVRRFAQPLGIDLPKWEGRIIETKKGVVRLMSVSERAKQLFGEGGADAVADWIVEDPKRDLQLMLFPELEKHAPPKHTGRRGRKKIIIDEESLRSGNLGGHQEATTLDRVHAAMLLQAGGQANALRQLIKAEMERGPEFLRLANALSALYPKGSEEKRLVDAMLHAVPR